MTPEKFTYGKVSIFRSYGPLFMSLTAYLENHTRDTLIIYFSPFIMLVLNSRAFNTVDGIHPFMIIKLRVIPLQCGRTIRTWNVLRTAFVYPGMVLSKSSYPSQMKNKIALISMAKSMNSNSEQQQSLVNMLRPSILTRDRVVRMN